MYGVSIDDRPDAPVGTPATRRTIAIHWEWTTEYSREEMAAALGVTKQTVENYLAQGPNDAVKEQMADVESEVRLAAVAELKSQLKAAGHRSRTAEKPVTIYETDDGDIEVRDVHDDETGELLAKKPVPQDMQLLPDEQARFYSRDEAREIIEQLVDITGAGEPDEQRVDMEMHGEVTHSVELDSETAAALREATLDE